jgi:hypothetical protein
MKKILSISVIAIIAIVYILSCDKISKPYTAEENIVSCDTPSFPVLNNVIQKYLLEDYTGHKCPNCPQAQRDAVGLKAQMGDTLIVMAIHSGSQARPEASNGPCSYSADYRTEVGNYYTDKFSISIYPSGMINRMVFGGKRVFTNSVEWKNNMNTISRIAPKIGIQIIPASNNNNAKEACVFVKTTLLSDISQQIRLSVLLIEDSIVSPQKDRTADSCQYVHNHVLRTPIAAKEGDNLEISKKDEFQIKGYTLKLSDAWRKENCHVIAFVFDLATDEILQVEEVELIK